MEETLYNTINDLEDILRDNKEIKTIMATLTLEQLQVALTYSTLRIQYPEENLYSICLA